MIKCVINIANFYHHGFEDYRQIQEVQEDNCKYYRVIGNGLITQQSDNIQKSLNYLKSEEYTLIVGTKEVNQLWYGNPVNKFISIWKEKIWR